MACASRSLILAVSLSFALGSASAAPPSPKPVSAKAGADFFEKQIRPILVQHCYQCHSGDAKKAKGGFLLDTREGLRKGGKSGPVITPGHPDESLLIEAVRYESLQMPPKGQLPEELIDKLVRWVEMGAPDPRLGKAMRAGNKIDFAQARKFWAFQRPKAVKPPAVHDSAWPVTDIDRFIRTRQEAERLQPVADADRTTLIRRVTFDLTGLPPATAQIETFLKDQSANAFATVVDRLLASPQFGERWARHWLDVVRYGESTGKDVNLPYRYAWRYRNYVIDALNADKPYNRFIIEQLAGDMLSPRDAAERDSLKVATGFLALGAKSIAQNEEQFRYDVIDDQIDVTTRAFLGLTVACARCHDHKYDPVPTADYYALAGVFRSTQILAGVKPGRAMVSETRLLHLTGPGQNKSSSDKDEKARRTEIEKLEKQLDQLRQQLQRPPAKKGPQNKGSGKPPANPKQIREEIKSVQERLDKLEIVPSSAQDLAMGVREGKASNSPLLNRGELRDKGRLIPRGVLTVLKPPDFHIDPNHSGRLAVAGWIASKDNPLTARVMVNRVWEHLFGQGLVNTVDNFGALGEEPSNPELLDTLAVRFMNDQNWSLKKLIRSIVLSRVYRLSSSHHAGNYVIDPSNKYLWRMERRRLDAEEIRDAMLAASGQLDLARPDGSPVLGLDNGQVRGGKMLQEARKPTNYRSVYLPVLRGLVPEMLQVFDVADPSLIVGQRDVTTVAPQALFMMNNPFALGQSALTARRVLTTGGPGPDGRIDLAYQLALGRPARPREKSLIKDYLANYRKAVASADGKVNPQFAAWTSFCQTLFASGEFRYLY
jgi:mono/diheme cytochrome c family protein